MKTNFVKMMMLPIAAFMLASAAAVTTSDAKVSKTVRPSIIGYIHSPLPSSCEPISVNCDVSGTNLCTSGISQVFDLDSETTCANPLYKD